MVEGQLGHRHSGPRRWRAARPSDRRLRGAIGGPARGIGGAVSRTSGDLEPWPRKTSPSRATYWVKALAGILSGHLDPEMTKGDRQQNRRPAAGRTPTVAQPKRPERSLARRSALGAKAISRRPCAVWDLDGARGRQDAGRLPRHAGLKNRRGRGHRARTRWPCGRSGWLRGRGRPPRRARCRHPPQPL